MLDENSTLSDTIDQYNLMNASLEEATSAYTNWLNAQSASQTGDMFDSALDAITKINDTLNHTDSDDYGRIGNADYKTAVEFVLPEGVDSSDQEAVNSYLKSLKKYLTLDDDGNADGLNIAAYCEKAVEKGLMVLEDGEYRIAGQMTMEEFAAGMEDGLAFTQAVFGEMQEFGGEFDWSDEAVQTFGDLGVAATEAAEHLRSLEENSDLKLVLDVSSFEDEETAVATLQSDIDQLNDYKAKLDVDSTEYQEANTIIQYCIAQRQILNEPAVMTVDTSQITGDMGEALSLLQQFQSAQDTIEMQAAIGADTSEAEAELASLTSRIQEVNIPAELDIDISSAETIQSSISGLTAEMIVTAGVDSSLVEAYQAADHNSDGLVTWNNETSKVDKYANTVQHGSGIVVWGNNTVNVKTSFTATGKINWSGSGGHSVNGTAHINGTAQGRARANGNWGTAPGGKTLVGELGTEIVVDPRTGKWYTVGENGAEFRDIPKNAIVFNHLQSQSLLENGFALGRGSSLATGTAMVTGGIKVSQAKQSTTSSSSKKKSSSKNSSSKSSSSKSAAKALEAFQEWFEKLFDWIEVKLSRLERLTDNYIQRAEAKAKNGNYGKIASNSTEKSTGASNYYIKALDSIGKQLTANRNGASKYKSEANAVLNQAVKRGVISKTQSSTIKTKVANGTINISEYGEKMQEVIKDYQQWYEKSLDCSDAVQDLLDQYTELAEALYNLPLDKLDDKLEDLSNAEDILNSRYDVTGTAADKNRILAEQNSNAAAVKAANDEAAKTTAKNLKTAMKAIDKTTDSALKGLTSAQKKQIVADVKAGKSIDYTQYGGSLSDKGKKALIQYNAALEANEEASYNAEKASYEYTAALRDTAQEMFNNIQTEWENIMSSNSFDQSMINEYISQAEAKGYMLSGDFYNALIESEQKNLEQLQQEKADLLSTLESQMQSGNIKAGTDEWYEMCAAIDDVTLAIEESTTALMEYDNELRQLKWDAFDTVQERIENITDEADFLIDLLSRNDDLFDDRGNMTSNGEAVAGLHAANYNTDMALADRYAEEIKALDAEIAADPFDNDLLERRQELLEAQRDAIQAAEDEKDALKDLVKDGIDAQIDAMADLIDKYKDALDSQKDLYDYQNTVRDKTKEIASLQK